MWDKLRVLRAGVEEAGAGGGGGCGGGLRGAVASEADKSRLPIQREYCGGSSRNQTFHEKLLEC